MDTDRMTREQAIDLVGLATVEKVEAMNCEMTNRAIDDGTVEFRAETDAGEDENGYSRTLEAYYYQDDNEEFKACEDLSNLEWSINHYAVRS